jgi:hypothetical protein
MDERTEEERRIYEKDRKEIFPSIQCTDFPRAFLIHDAKTKCWKGGMGGSKGGRGGMDRSGSG